MVSSEVLTVYCTGVLYTVQPRLESPLIGRKETFTVKFYTVILLLYLTIHWHHFVLYIQTQLEQYI